MTISRNFDVACQQILDALKLGELAYAEKYESGLIDNAKIQLNDAEKKARSRQESLLDTAALERDELIASIDEILKTINADLESGEAVFRNTDIQYESVQSVDLDSHRGEDHTVAIAASLRTMAVQTGEYLVSLQNRTSELSKIRDQIELEAELTKKREEEARLIEKQREEEAWQKEKQRIQKIINISAVIGVIIIIPSVLFVIIKYPNLLLILPIVVGTYIVLIWYFSKTTAFRPKKLNNYDRYRDGFQSRYGKKERRVNLEMPAGVISYVFQVLVVIIGQIFAVLIAVALGEMIGLFFITINKVEDPSQQIALLWTAPAITVGSMVVGIVNQFDFNQLAAIQLVNLGFLGISYLGYKIAEQLALAFMTGMIIPEDNSQSLLVRVILLLVLAASFYVVTRKLTAIQVGVGVSILLFFVGVVSDSIFPGLFPANSQGVKIFLGLQIGAAFCTALSIRYANRNYFYTYENITSRKFWKKVLSAK